MSLKSGTHCILISRKPGLLSNLDRPVFCLVITKLSLYHFLIYQFLCFLDFFTFVSLLYCIHRPVKPRAANFSCTSINVLTFYPNESIQKKYQIRNRINKILFFKKEILQILFIDNCNK